jgi:hypothetical protein
LKYRFLFGFINIFSENIVSSKSVLGCKKTGTLYQHFVPKNSALQELSGFVSSILSHIFWIKSRGNQETVIKKGRDTRPFLL